MADIMTFEEHRGAIDKHAIAWVGDGNNVATSWIHAMTKLGGELRLGCPEQLSPDARALAWAKDKGGRVKVTTSAEEAVADAGENDARRVLVIGKAPDGVPQRNGELRIQRVGRWPVHRERGQIIIALDQQRRISVHR